jgi:hypothetical protein
MIGDPDGTELDVTGEVFYWRGPAPHHFVTVPDDESALIQEVASAVTYGWGMIPVSARIGHTTFTTSLFPKDGRYLVPLKDAVRAAEGITVDDTVTVLLTISAPR